jgi:hypothetical protein
MEITSDILAEVGAVTSFPVPLIPFMPIGESTTIAADVIGVNYVTILRLLRNVN